MKGLSFEKNIKGLSYISTCLAHTLLEMSEGDG